MRLADLRRKLIQAGASLVAVTTLAFAAAVIFSEKISVGDGFGFDGAVYGAWARVFPAPLFDGSIDWYHIQRILPSAVVHGTLRLLRVELTPPHIIHAFEGWAIGLVCAGACAWTAIAKRLCLSPAARWFGAAALFGSYGCLKWTAYYPVLTDLWSVVLALLQLLFFLDRRLVALALVTFLGAFTWPTSATVGAVLIVFLPFSAATPAASVPLRPRIRLLLAGAAVVAWTWLCISIVDSGYAISGTVAPMCRPLVRLSVIASGAFLFGALSVLVDDRALFDWRLLGRYLLRRNLLVAAGLMAAARALQARAAPAPNPYPLSEVLRMTAFTAIQKPAVFLVAHVMFLGPVLLVIVMRWRAVTALIRRWGPGLVAVAGLGTVLFLNSESRHLWNVAAMFVPFAVKALDEMSWTPRQFLGLGALTLASSNVWLTYQDPIWPDALQFPGQLFFMTNGPWMSLEMYAIQAAITAGLGVWMARQLSAAEDRARAQPALPKRPDPGAAWTQPSVLVDAAFRSLDQ